MLIAAARRIDRSECPTTIYGCFSNRTGVRKEICRPIARRRAETGVVPIMQVVASRRGDGRGVLGVESSAVERGALQLSVFMFPGTAVVLKCIDKYAS